MSVLYSRSKLSVDAFPLQFQQDLTYLKSSAKGNADNNEDSAESSVCYTSILYQRYLTTAQIESGSG